MIAKGIRTHSVGGGWTGLTIYYLGYNFFSPNPLRWGRKAVLKYLLSIGPSHSDWGGHSFFVCFFLQVDRDRMDARSKRDSLWFYKPTPNGAPLYMKVTFDSSIE